MAIIVSVRERRSGLDAEWSEDFVRTYSRSFWVEVDSCLTAWPTLFLGHASLPRIGSAYPGDPYAWCRKIKVKPDPKRPIRWTVTADYSSKWDKNPETHTENPLLRPPKWTFEAGLEKKAAEKDLNDKLIASSADEKFEPPYEMEQAMQIFRVERNVATFITETETSYIGALNSNSWTVHGMEIPVKCCRCTRNAATEVWEGQYHYYQQSLEFHRRLAGQFVESLLDQGTIGFDLVSGDWKTFIDERTGRNVTTPVLLDGAGERLAAGADPVFIAFKFFPTANFANMGLT